MLNQAQNIRSFVEKLTPPISWPDCLVRRSNGDEACVEVPFAGKRYEFLVESAYISPHLGKIAMTDLVTGHIITGQKTDELWKTIADYMKRQAADSPAHIGAVQTGQGPALAVEPPAIPNGDGRLPHLSQGVKYYTERGEVIGGMTELAAIVTRINPDGTLFLTVLAPTTEQFWRDNMPRRSEDRQFNCWDFADPPKAHASESLEAFAIAKRLMDDHILGHHVARTIVEPAANIIPAKRGPGRPRKFKSTPSSEAAMDEAVAIYGSVLERLASK